MSTILVLVIAVTTLLVIQVEGATNNRLSLFACDPKDSSHVCCTSNNRFFSIAKPCGDICAGRRCDGVTPTCPSAGTPLPDGDPCPTCRGGPSGDFKCDGKCDGGECKQPVKVIHWILLAVGIVALICIIACIVQCFCGCLTCCNKKN